MRVISQLIYYRKTYQSVKRDLCDRNSLIIECVLRLALARDRERKGKWEGGGRSLARGGESAISRSPDVHNGEDLKEAEPPRLLVLEVSGDSARELEYSEMPSLFKFLPGCPGPDQPRGFFIFKLNLVLVSVSNLGLKLPTRF